MVTSALKAGRFYAYALIQLLIEPGLFFRELEEKNVPRRALEFMVVCCLFYTFASLLTGVYPHSAGVMAAIYFINAAGMILVSSFLGYIAMVMIAGKKSPYSIVFSIYAFSSGVTLFLSWLPFLVLITEPWKWWLVCIGLKNTCKISWKKSIGIAAASLVITFFLIYSAHLAVVNPN